MTSNFNNNSSRETTTTMKLIKPVQIIKVFNNASNNNMCGSVKTKLKCISAFGCIYLQRRRTTPNQKKQEVNFGMYYSFNQSSPFNHEQDLRPQSTSLRPSRLIFVNIISFSQVHMLRQTNIYAFFLPGLGLNLLPTRLPNHRSWRSCSLHSVCIHSCLGSD